MLDHGWAEWFGPLIAVGETLVGIGLVFGVFTGIAAFFGAVMNSVLGLIGIGVMIAWKTSSWWGVDRFLLPRLGASWQPGTLLGRAKLFSRPTSRQEVLRAMEEWIRIVIGVGLGLFALIELTGAVQVGTLPAAALIAVTGLGWLFMSSGPSSETGWCPKLRPGLAIGVFRDIVFWEGADKGYPSSLAHPVGDAVPP